MTKLYDLARMTTATVGTGTITLVSNASGCLTFAQAGVVDQDTVWYGIADGANSEVGWGIYTSASTTLTRNPYKSTNANAAISLSGSAQVFICAIAGDGGDIIPSTTNPSRGFDAPINLQINASVATNILTISVKGNNGADPSQTNPVLIPFRDSTIVNGGPVWVPVTAALSINTNATGATLGTVNSVPFRLWVIAFNNAGTVVLALWQSVTGGGTPTAIAPLAESGVASTTAISGTATSAGVFYTPNGTTLTSKAFRIIGYVDYASGLTTAGTYASAPTTIQLFGPGIKKPGDVVQSAFATKSTADTTSTATFINAGPAISISPSSAPNIIHVDARTNAIQPGAASSVVKAKLMRGGTAGTQFGGTMIGFESVGVGTVIYPGTMEGYDLPGTTASTSYQAAFASDGTNTGSYGNTNITPVSTLRVEEIMV